MTLKNFTADFKSAFLGPSKNSLSSKLANAIVEKAAGMIDNEVTCKAHKGLPLVAFDQNSQYFGCVQCLYDGNHQNPEFITLKARETYDSFKANY